jgi:hypothetical protein
MVGRKRPFFRPGLTPPWLVVGSDFDATAHRLDIHIGFPPGSRFVRPTCGPGDCPAYDNDQMTWRPLNFFQHEVHLIHHLYATKGAFPRLGDSADFMSLFSPRK